MRREAVLALRACVATFAACAACYPALVWMFAHLLFPWRAEGSLIHDDDRTIIGSELIAQKFESGRYFHPRPSAVDYRADASGASNLAPTGAAQRRAIAARAEALGATPERPAPADLVTASGSGLDPDVSPEAARFQAPRVAAARGLPLARLIEHIERSTARSGALIGAPPRVNVLLLNRALDQMMKPR